MCEVVNVFLFIHSLAIWGYRASVEALTFIMQLFLIRKLFIYCLEKGFEIWSGLRLWMLAVRSGERVN